jgi:AAA family ATP:ADP antiporter
MTPAPHGPARLLRRLVLLEPGEGAILASSTAYFFCLLAGYYLLRPVREAFGIARGADKLPWGRCSARA